jgi:hypothetical protein
MLPKFNNYHKRILIYILIFFYTHTAAQNQLNGYDFITNLKTDANIGQIDFYLMSADPCANNNAKNLYGINSTILNTNLNAYLNFKVQVVDCNGKILEQSISLSLSLLQEGFNENIITWDLAGKLYKNPYLINISNGPDKSKLIQKGQVKPTDPDSLIIKNNNSGIVSYGEEVIMEIMGGDDLTNSNNTYWSWHIGSNTSSEIITQDKNYKFIPSSNTTVYVNAVTKTTNGLIKSKTVSKKLYVDTKSYEPVSITSESKTICSIGNGSILILDGGKLGKQAQWVWYKNGCGDEGTEIIAKGVDNIKVIPTISTKYFVRAEGLENYTNCKVISIEVVDPPSKPLIQLMGSSEICQGESINILLPGQPIINSDKSQWEWYKKDFVGPLNNPGSVDKLNLYGPDVKISPDKSSYYYVISKGGVCNSVISELVNVKVKNKSSNPIISSDLIQNTHKFRLSVNSTNLGSNAKWVWYEGKFKNEIDPFSSNLNKINKEGNTIEIKSNKRYEKYIFISGQGDCDAPPIINGSATIFKYQKRAKEQPENTIKTRNSYSTSTTKPELKNRIGNSYSNLKNKVQIFNSSESVSSQFILNIGSVFNGKNNLSTTSYTIGSTKSSGRDGGSYFKYISTNSNAFPTEDLTADTKSQTILNYPNDGTYYKFNKDIKTFNVQSYIIGTLMSDLNQSVIIYGGYGYGEVKTIWGYDKYNTLTNKYISTGYAKNNTKSYGGLALELGVIFRVWYFNVNGGIGSIFGISSVKDPNITNTKEDPYADTSWSFEKYIKAHIGIGISILSRK